MTFDPNRIVMSGGATGAHELMAFCLANPGDAFLVPTPYYPGCVFLKLFLLFRPCSWLNNENRIYYTFMNYMISYIFNH